ncbi:MAG: ABC transporter substrate-binding protein [Acidimicrobiales bacterium]
MGRSRVVLPAVSVALVVIAACSSGSGDDAPVQAAPRTVVVASFNFPESHLLAEIYSQALEGDGYAVERSFDLGPRELVVPALLRGLVDFVPEYAGTALQFLSAGREGGQTDTASTSTALREVVTDLPVRALAPAPAQDANAFVVTRATADRYGLVTLSDLAEVAGSLVFGGPPECPSRPLCLEGLENVYGITFAEVVSLDTGGPLTHQALEGGGIDVALLFTTDPVLGGDRLVELTDDRHLQPAENITPLVHGRMVERLGEGVVDRTDMTSAKLTTSALRELNRQVAAGKDDIPTIAARWLRMDGVT